MPSRDEILAVYEAGPDIVVAWVQQLLDAHQRHMVQLVAAHELQVANLTARVAQLETRLGKDSHNSHQPPSSDGPAKRPRTRSLRKRSGKPSGGQAGHPGVTRCLVDDPDVVVAHLPKVCTGCEANLESATVAGRSPAGANQFCRIRDYISMLCKPGYSVLDGLTSGFAGQPFMPRLEP